MKEAGLRTKTPLLVTDILVEFEDGSLADVEIQKLGYAFRENAAPAMLRIRC